MPELPEAETIVRFLRPHLRGLKILDMWTNTPRLFRNQKSFLIIKRESRGIKIKEVTRIGKNISLELSNGKSLLIHLMMTGKLLLNYQNLKEPHIHFWIRLSRGHTLALHDIRKFGQVRLVKTGESLKNIGPDATVISFNEFRKVFQKRKGIIKSLLLTQSLISGIGNIYADEILWYAGLKPTRKVYTLTPEEFRKLYESIHRVLKLAIQKGGTSSRNYRKPDNTEGGYYKIRQAYQRTGEKCRRDGGIIKRIVIGQRSTHYCLYHQK